MTAKPESWADRLGEWFDRTPIYGLEPPTARLYRGDEDQCDAFEARETQARLGAHNYEGAGPGPSSRPWPLHSMSTNEQPPFRSQLAAAMWLEEHGEDSDYSEDET